MLIDREQNEDDSLREDAKRHLQYIMTTVEQLVVTSRCPDKTDEDVNERVAEVFARVLEALGLPEDTDYPLGPWMNDLTP